MTWFWGLLAAAALLWPDHISSPFDGVPLDRTAEAILVGVVFPLLLVLHPHFLATRLARGAIVALVVWRTCAASLFVQDGWCVRFEPSRPYAKDATGAPHAWDLRADWRSPDPACSAIMTRSYHNYREFPAWFFNLPPPNENSPVPEDRPPAAVTGFRVRGFLSTPSAGSLAIETGPGMTTTLAVDGVLSTSPVQLQPGVHQVVISGTMTGRQWRLVPAWNGRDLWSNVTATVRRPSTSALRLRPLARWIPFGIAALLLGSWTLTAIARIGSVTVLAWTFGTSLVIGWLTSTGRTMAARWMLVTLAGAAFVPVPARLRNVRGAILLVAAPWLTFVVVFAAPGIGLWGLYAFGNDFWMYQRYGYRIFMQGYWLEGGSPTFYFQPLYRWISGLLHVVFGDSSVGEFFWDGACLASGALLAFRITRALAGFRWGLAAASAPLAVFAFSSAQDLVGRGLSEISSTGLLSVAALCAMRARPRRTAVAIAAGVLATLAFYTRLNNLPMALGVAAFSLSLHVPVRDLVRPWAWRWRFSLRTAASVCAAIGLGVLAFAWRTWYYTGIFSVFHGTARERLAIWQPGMPVGIVASRMADSVMMVLTVNDPPRFDIYVAPVLAGAVVAVLSVAGVPRLRDLPAPAVLFFFSGIVGALIARGSAYAGRFSVHVMPITCTLTVCAIAALLRSKPHLPPADPGSRSRRPLEVPRHDTEPPRVGRGRLPGGIDAKVDPDG
jgi:hypothetical protein